MTIAIWIGNDVGLMKKGNFMEGVEGCIVEDNFDRLYTKYGFVYSLKNFELDYAAVMDNRIPQVPKHIQDDTTVVNWMLIDHHGDVYQIDYWNLIEDDKRTKKMSVWSMPAGKVAKMTIGGDEGDAELVAGFIKVCTDKEKIRNFVSEGFIERGREIHWLNKDDIVAKLHELYPLNSNLG